MAGTPKSTNLDNKTNLSGSYDEGQTTKIWAEDHNDIAATANAVYLHSLTGSGNPHSVNASDVGLGNVNNIADASQVSLGTVTVGNIDTIANYTAIPNHNALPGLNAGDNYEHITASQVSGLHTSHSYFTSVNAVDAIEAVGTATPVSSDTLIFRDNTVLKRVAFSSLTNAILTGLDAIGEEGGFYPRDWSASSTSNYQGWLYTPAGTTVKGYSYGTPQANWRRNVVTNDPAMPYWQFYSNGGTANERYGYAIDFTPTHTGQYRAIFKIYANHNTGTYWYFWVGVSGVQKNNTQPTEDAYSSITVLLGSLNAGTTYELQFGMRCNQNASSHTGIYYVTSILLYDNT